ncbi:MAG: CvpA family protein [Bacteroidetes bacterium]|nr:CvpA family protein [Bacteroidota bacterium]
MNWLDIVIAIPLIYGFYQGFTKGIVHQIAMIIGMIVGLFLAFKLAGTVNVLLADKFDSNSPILPLISFILVIAAVVLVLIFFAKFIETILKATGLNLFNKIAGGLLGALKFGLIVSVFLNMTQQLEPAAHLIAPEIKKEAYLYQPTLALGSLITPALEMVKKEFKDNLPGKDLDKVD